MGRPVVALLTAMWLAPLLVHLMMVRRERRPIHVFDDIIGYLGAPLMWSCVVVPYPVAASRLVLGAGTVIMVVSVWRLISQYLRTRAAERRVDGSPDGR
jgi:hypothetical protein